MRDGNKEKYVMDSFLPMLHWLQSRLTLPDRCGYPDFILDAQLSGLGVVQNKIGFENLTWSLKYFLKSSKHHEPILFHCDSYILKINFFCIFAHILLSQYEIRKNNMILFYNVSFRIATKIACLLFG